MREVELLLGHVAVLARSSVVRSPSIRLRGEAAKVCLASDDGGESSGRGRAPLVDAAQTAQGSRSAAGGRGKTRAHSHLLLIDRDLGVPLCARFEPRDASKARRRPCGYRFAALRKVQLDTRLVLRLTRRLVERPRRSVFAHVVPQRAPLSVDLHRGGRDVRGASGCCGGVGRASGGERAPERARVFTGPHRPARAPPPPRRARLPAPATRRQTEWLL